MIRSLFLFSLMLILHISASGQAQPLKKGMKIRKSITIRKGVYQFTSDTNLLPVVVIEGNGITVDFNDAVLNGSVAGTDPDQFKGLAILVRKGRNIRIKNLKAKGYKLALMAEGVDGLILENCDLSYNYRQRLKSTRLKENEEDWLSYHQNEKDEWLRYGAAIYLKDCHSAIVRNCRVTGGQNGLMMMRCNGGRVYNNDISFNSGVGIGIYRSSGNQFMYNRVIFNVRGYSDGIYHRGQDSAGFLVYEQSNNNLFYKNAATHSGDGFFLWAGQSTMDTGEGGSNDNILLDNDFSYAPTNGVELTFSRNKVIHNRIFECDHGIWGGYSFETEIRDNIFRGNRVGVAIEHGQLNLISNNIFDQDKTGIRLWSRAKQPADWVYAQKRDTRSRKYVIAMNSFSRNGTALHIKGTDSVRLLNNRISYADTDLVSDSTLTHLDTTQSAELMLLLSEEKEIPVPVIDKPANPFKGLGRLSGRKNIRMTEWGPYNYAYPAFWMVSPKDSGIIQMELLGPAGNWQILGISGLKMGGRNFKTGDTLRLEAMPVDEISITARFVPAVAFTGWDGKMQAAKKPVTIVFKALRNKELGGWETE